MKNTRIYLAAMTVAMLFVASCQKENIVNQEFSASMEVATSGGKTTLDGTTLKWVYGTDQVSITSCSTSETSTSETTTTYATSTFTAVPHSSGNQSYAKLNLNEDQQELPEGTGVTYKAIYPAAIAGNNGTTVTIPAVQASVSGELTGYPMYAPETSSKTIQFKNLCSVLKIGLTGTESVSRIEVVTDKYINGSFTIGGTATEPTLECLTSSPDHKKVTTLTLSSPVQLNESTSSYFYIYLPVQDYHYIKINVYNATEQIFTKAASITNGVTLERSKYHLLAFQSIDFIPNVLSGEFSVSATQKVSFSKGNLLLVSHQQSSQNNIYTTTDVYKFANHQYDRNEGTNPTYDKWLFEWGTSSEAPSMFTRWKNYTDNTHNHTGSIQNDTYTDWRCLTKAEWDYLLKYSNHRMSYYNKYGDLQPSTINRCFTLGKVNNVKGMIIFPDVFYWPLDEKEATFDRSTYTSWGGATNSYTLDQWKILEGAGCVFLPTTGRKRNNYNTPDKIDDYGLYWSSSVKDYATAKDLFIRAQNIASFFDDDGLSKNNYHIAIRLVRNASNN